jgi:hypothetical protein
LESTLIRAEALFRRFQRTVEAIDKKSNFPAPKLRQRNSATPKSPTTPTPETATASTSGTDTVTAGSTNNGASSSIAATSSPNSADKGKGKSKLTVVAEAVAGRELEEQKPKVISEELRALLSKKVEILPRKVVRKEGEGLGKVVASQGK